MAKYDLARSLQEASRITCLVLFCLVLVVATVEGSNVDLCLSKHRCFDVVVVAIMNVHDSEHVWRKLNQYYLTSVIEAETSTPPIRKIHNTLSAVSDYLMTGHNASLVLLLVTSTISLLLDNFAP